MRHTRYRGVVFVINLIESTEVYTEVYTPGGWLLGSIYYDAIFKCSRLMVTGTTLTLLVVRACRLLASDRDVSVRPFLIHVVTVYER